jgi:MerR family transcriptional regulator, redox-sensitive transcriptional activator SoxR
MVTMHTLSIGEVSHRTGAATSALRFYEDQGLIHSERNAGGQRRFHREVIRRVSFIRTAQQVGLTLSEIREFMSALPDERTPTRDDWSRVAASWGPRIDDQIQLLERLKDRVVGCIGCGCLSLDVCPIMNPQDELSSEGPGPRLLIHD